MKIKKHPTRRRIAIECAFCEHPTMNGNGVCRGCQETYRDGKRYQTWRASDDNKETYYIQRDELSFRSEFGMPSREVVTDERELAYGLHKSYGYSSRFSSVLLRLLAQPVLSFNTQAVYHSLRDNPKFYLGHVEYHDSGNVSRIGYEASGLLVAMRLSSDQAKEIRTFIMLAQEQLVYERQRGYNEGSHLIARMATGDITIADLNAALLKREGFK